MLRSYALPPKRSISFPSSFHPISLRVVAELNKLREWETKSCSSSTAETVQTGLVRLSEVYRCAEELVYSSHTQHEKVLETTLDHLVRLLDICHIVKDTQHKIKEQVLCLQSCFQRRGTESRVRDEISSYFMLRKKLKKESSKCIRALNKQCERKLKFVVGLKDCNLTLLVKVLREVNVMTSRVLWLLLLFLSSSGSRNQKKGGGCSLILKLRQVERVEKIMNEVGSVDDALFGVVNGKVEMAMANMKLNNLVISLDSIEGGLDLLFTRLIRYRVSILNVLTR